MRTKKSRWWSPQKSRKRKAAVKLAITQKSDIMDLLLNKLLDHLAIISGEAKEKFSGIYGVSVGKFLQSRSRNYRQRDKIVIQEQIQ